MITDNEQELPSFTIKILAPWLESVTMILLLILFRKLVKSQSCITRNLYEENEGQISSHENYGFAEYNNNLNCNYTISAATDDTVEVALVELDIENNNNCNFDKLIMRVISSGEEQTVCGNNVDDVRFLNPFTGQGPVELIFTSDSSERAGGFQIRNGVYLALIHNQFKIL